MIRRLFKRSGKWIADRIPEPMAAPETLQQRDRRWRLIGMLTAMAVVTLFAPSLIMISRCGMALLWLGLVLATLIQGATWLTTKLRTDAAWLDEQLAKDREP